MGLGWEGSTDWKSSLGGGGLGGNGASFGKSGASLGNIDGRTTEEPESLEQVPANNFLPGRTASMEGLGFGADTCDPSTTAECADVRTNFSNNNFISSI